MPANSDEYLEGILAALHKAELEGDENVLRTLPLIITAMGLVGGLVAFITSQLPRAWGPLTLGVICGLAVLAVFFFLMLWLFWQAVRPRVYANLDPGPGLIKYKMVLQDHFSDAGRTAQEVDALVLESLRRYVHRKYAEATARNRGHNRAKYKARSRLLTATVVMIALAFLLTLTMFVVQRMFIYQENFDAGGQSQT